MKWIRRLYRYPALIVLLLGGMVTQLALFPWLTVARRRAVIGGWSRLLIGACGLRLSLQGSDAAAFARLAPGRLVVSNHISWLDIFAINSVAPASFVAKIELRSWPLAGQLITWAGTVFVDRSRRSAVAGVLEQMAVRLQAGWPVGLFPEGTTSDGRSVLPFRAALFQAAIDARCEVVLIALRFRGRDGQPAPEALYVGDTSFLTSLWWILGAGGLQVELALLEVIAPAGYERTALASHCEAAVRQSLAPPSDQSAATTAPESPAARR